MKVVQLSRLRQIRQVDVDKMLLGATGATRSCQVVLCKSQQFHIIFLTSSAMETTHKGFHFNEDSKQLPQMDPLRPACHLNHLSHMEDLASHIEQPHVEANIQHKYYHEFKKIYLTSYRLWTEQRKQTKIKDTLTLKVNSIETQLTALHKTRRIEEEIEMPDEETDKRGSKRTRRTAQEIERKYNCQAEYCGRTYGSQGSLQQHIKLKHPQLYKLQLQQSLELQLF